MKQSTPYKKNELLYSKKSFKGMARNRLHSLVIFLVYVPNQYSYSILSSEKKNFICINFILKMNSTVQVTYSKQFILFITYEKA